MSTACAVLYLASLLLLRDIVFDEHQHEIIRSPHISSNLCTSCFADFPYSWPSELVSCPWRDHLYIEIFLFHTQWVSKCNVCRSVLWECLSLLLSLRPTMERPCSSSLWAYPCNYFLRQPTCVVSSGLLLSLWFRENVQGRHDALYAMLKS